MHCKVATWPFVQDNVVLAAAAIMLYWYSRQTSWLTNRQTERTIAYSVASTFVASPLIITINGSMTTTIFLCSYRLDNPCKSP